MILNISVKSVAHRPFRISSTRNKATNEVIVMKKVSHKKERNNYKRKENRRKRNKNEITHTLLFLRQRRDKVYNGVHYQVR